MTGPNPNAIAISPKPLYPSLIGSPVYPSARKVPRIPAHKIGVLPKNSPLICLFICKPIAIVPVMLAKAVSKT